MASWYRDPTAPEPNLVRITPIVFRVTPRGEREPMPSAESAELRLSAAPSWRASISGPRTCPIREALLSEPDGVVIA
jgi:hypothetical protein